MIWEFSKVFDLFCKILESFEWPEYSYPIIWLKDEGGCKFLKIILQSTNKLSNHPGKKSNAYYTTNGKNFENILWIEYDRGEIHDAY